MGREILLSPINHKYWMVMQEIQIGNYSVPKGFITDFASIPRVLWSLLPPWNDYGRASILHDYHYCSGTASRKEADNNMLEIMKEDKVGVIRRNLIYISVRLFGHTSYKNSKNLRNKIGVCKKIYLNVDGDFFEK